MNRADVLVALPSFDGSYTYEMTIALEGAIYKAVQRGYRCQPHRVRGSNIARNRNLSVEKARELKCKWIFWVDADVVIPAGTLVRMIERDLDIVSGMYFGKQVPYVPIAARFDRNQGKYQTLTEWPENQLLDDMDGVGGGCLFVKTAVFDKLLRPYFNFGVITHPSKDNEIIGEDFYFCRQAKQEGFKIHLDTEIQCGHIGAYKFDIHDFLGVKEFRDRERPNKEGEVLSSDN